MNLMEKNNELKKIMAAGLIFMAVSLFVSYIISEDKVERTLLWAEPGIEEQKAIINVNAKEIVPLSDKKTLPEKVPEPVHSGFKFDRTKMTENYIAIPKQDGENGLASITDEYVYRTVYVDIDEKLPGFYDESMVKRYAGNEEFNGKPEDVVLPAYMEAFLNGKEADEEDKEAYERAQQNKEKKRSRDPAVNIKISKIMDKGPKIRLCITFDRNYVPTLFEDDDNYYISLKRPKDEYSKILVVDLGHGGKDTGTFSGDGKVFEKDTVLDFGLKLKEIFDRQNDIKVYYTRLEDIYLYRRPRADLANGLEADFFLSIHNNNYTALGSPIDFNEIRGSEIHYNEKIKNTKVTSKRFAELILDNICKSIHTKKRGLVKGSGLYVLGHTKMPSALVEIGFLTNKEDLSLLQDDEKMEACAEAVYNAAVQAFKERGE